MVFVSTAALFNEKGEAGMQGYQVKHLEELMQAGDDCERYESGGRRRRREYLRVKRTVGTTCTKRWSCCKNVF